MLTREEVLNAGKVGRRLNRALRRVQLRSERVHLQDLLFALRQVRLLSSAVDCVPGLVEGPYVLFA